ncbi:MAG: hypothetical protein AAB917_02170 [Patescibacteria group bacterium]
MKNWSTDTRELEKNHQQLEIWKLEQLINFGLDGKKLNKETLKKYWASLSLDPYKKKFLSLFL